MGSDGAPVMLGRRSGVRVRLSEGLPDILALHCMAHRLEWPDKESSARFGALETMTLTP